MLTEIERDRQSLPVSASDCPFKERTGTHLEVDPVHRVLVDLVIGVMLERRRDVRHRNATGYHPHRIGLAGAIPQHYGFAST